MNLNHPASSNLNKSVDVNITDVKPVDMEFSDADLAYKQAELMTSLGFEASVNPNGWGLYRPYRVMNKIKSAILRFFEKKREKHAALQLRKKKRRAVRVIRDFVKGDKKHEGRIYLLQRSKPTDDYNFKKVYHAGSLKIVFARYIRGDVVEVFRLDTNEMIMQYADQSHQYYPAFSFPHDITCSVDGDEIIELLGEDYHKPNYNKTLED